MSRERVKSVCPYCGVGCGIVLEVDGGKIDKVVGDKTHPANKGRLCTKGQSCHVPLNEGRLATAYLRLRETTEQKPVAMGEAIAETARRLRAIIERDGPDAVSFYVSGQMSLEAQYLANKLAKGFIRTRHIEANSRLCMASAASGYKLSLGADAPPGSYDDLDQADVFLVIGANMADCHPILFLRVLERVKQGAKLIVVDPRRTATAEKADLFLQLRPGADIALLNGLLRLLLESGKVDADFIAAHTEGWEVMPDFLSAYALDGVARVTGLAAADLRQAADWIGGTKNFVSLWTMGLNQSTAGTWNTNALCNLHLAMGAICRPGAGPFSLTGQPNAMGGREMGYMGNGLPGQRSTVVAEDRAFVERIWNLPDGTLRDAPMTGAVNMFDEMAAGRIKACWIICTNPVASMPARARTIAGLKAAELVIVQEAFLDTETNPYADILLPGALWVEADGVMVNSERNMTLMRQAVAPPGEAMADWRIIAAVARAMGYAGFGYDSAEEVFEEIKNFANPDTGYDISGVSHERLRQTPLQWPCAPGAGPRNGVRYVAGGAPRFPTPSGRARFFARPCLPPAELPDEEYPFILNTGRLQHQWHTLTKTGKVPQLNRLNEGPFVEICPQDAAVLGLGPGDQLALRSRRGQALLPAVVSERVNPGSCFAPFHWNDVFGDDLAVNALTSPAVDAVSLQPEFKFCAVALKRVPAPAAKLPEETGLLALENLPGPALAADERLYLRGFMQGVAMRPEGVPELPATAPVAPERRVFLNGVLAGMFARLTPAPTLAPATAPALTILYASQTGTAEAAARAAAARLAAVAKPLNDVAPCTLAGTVLFYTSSFGDGDPPDNGARFWRALMQEPAPALGAVRFGVLAFGDSAYAQFCGFGRKLEERLLALGAQKLLERAECEPGDEGMKDAWLARAEVVLGAPEASVKAVLRRPSGISRNAPYRARLVANKRLNMPGSEKDTRQLIFDLGNSGLVYEPGDALGVWPQSDPADLAAFMHLAGVDGDFADRDVTRLTPALLKFYAARAPSLAAHLAGLDEAGLRDFTWGRQLIDLLAAYQVQASADEWRAVLKPLAPRLYSISSSLKAHPGEVHLTINILRYQCGGRQSGGLGSRFLADRAEDAEIFVQPTSHFRLPEDDSVPVIMIGPGTGIAPFRGFLQERRMRGAKGRNWLIFGEQRAACDFYYCEELEGLAREGILQRLSTAFSRDQEHKIYVQDRLRAEGDILWAWLQEGAHLYVCGDAVRMARDVDAALRDIVAVHGGITGPAAGEFVDSLMAQGRYLRDVY